MVSSAIQTGHEVENSYRPRQHSGAAARAPKRPRWAALENPSLIAAVALLARFAYMAVFRTWVFPSGHNHYAFGMETGSIARSIAAGEGFSSPFKGLSTGPTAWIAPIYPYFCALVFKLFGIFSATSAAVILGVNCIMSAATVVPLMRLANRLFGRATAVSSGWIWALVPYFMCWPASWVWEISFSAFYVTALVLLTLDLPQGTTRRWAAFGALGGVAALTNPALLTVMPIAALWAIFRSTSPRRAFMRAALAAAVCVVVVSPWMVRNRVVMGKWVFLRDNFAFEFSIGNYPGGSGMGWRGLHPVENDKLMNAYISEGEIRFLEGFADYPKRFIHTHRADFVRMTAHRFQAFWDGTSQLWSKFDQDLWRPLPFFAVSILALLGCILAIGNRQSAGWLLGLVCLLYPLPYYVTYANTRYRHAIEPLMVVFGAYFAVELVKRIQARLQPRTASQI